MLALVIADDDDTGGDDDEACEKNSARGLGQEDDQRSIVQLGAEEIRQCGMTYTRR